jgi:hypothetical protein
VIAHEAEFTSLVSCESWTEDESEWDIERKWQVGTTIVENSWEDMRRSTNRFPNYEPLLDSALDVYLTAEQSLGMFYTVEENDPVDDEQLRGPSLYVQPDGFEGIEWNHITFEERDGDCRARVSLYVEQRLYVP